MPKHYLANQNHELTDYIYEKIVMLRYEFCLRLTTDELIRFYNQPDKTRVDIYARRLIMEKL